MRVGVPEGGPPASLQPVHAARLGLEHVNRLAGLATVDGIQGVRQEVQARRFLRLCARQAVGRVPCQSCPLSIMVPHGAKHGLFHHKGTPFPA